MIEMIELIDIDYPHIIYYNDDHSVTPSCSKKITDILRITYTNHTTWHGLIKELENGAKFLALHVDMIERSHHSTAIEFIDAITTISKFINRSSELKIAIVIKPTTQLSVVKTLQKTGAQGILLDLNHYSVEEAAIGTNAFINNIPYWPKHILDYLPGAPNKKSSPTIISLTVRQQEIFNLITERAASNKVIARALGISESTVKLHVSGIFKKYGVKSRTQLAVFTQV